MPGNRLFVAAVVKEPLARHLTVFQGLLGPEGFGLDQKQGGFRVHLPECFTDLGAVDVGHVMARYARLSVGLECLAHQFGPEVGAADTDAHDVSKGFAGVSGAAAAQHAVHQRFHPCQGALYLGNDVLAVHHDGLRARITKGRMQGGAVLGDVHAVTPQQCLAPGFQVAAACQCQQRLKHLVGEPVLGEIQ